MDTTVLYHHNDDYAVEVLAVLPGGHGRLFTGPYIWYGIDGNRQGH